MGQVKFDSGTTVGTGAGAFVIAEAGVNHNGEVARALELVGVAAAAGADAVKFQTFRAAKLASAAAPKAEYQKAGTSEETQLEMLRRLELDLDAHRLLVERCAELGIVFLSTPFDHDSARLLQDLEVPLFKVSSGDLTNHPLLRQLAAFGRPLVLSTGMARLGEVEDALLAVEDTPNADVALLHCVSNYPAAIEDVNLRAMDTLRVFGKPVGYSDHTLGIAVSLAAVARGAQIVEKHFTLDRTLPGPDHRASLEPDELAAMITGIRAVEAALGDGRKLPAASELDTAQVARKSVVATRDLVADTVLSATDLTIKRPGTGIAPEQVHVLVGLTLRRNVAADAPLDWDDFK